MVMLEAIGRAAMLEQLAEEAAELAQAVLKGARIERGENPTVTKDEAEKLSLRSIRMFGSVQQNLD